MYVTVKLVEESGESNVQTPLAHQCDSFGSPRKEGKKKKVSPDKDSMLDTLTLLEMYLGKFVSTGQNLKLAMATGFSTKVHLVKAMVFPVVMCGCES